MAWDEETSSKNTRKNNRQNNKGCTTKKSLLVASSLLIFAALVAFYIGLVCQHMYLTIVDTSIFGFTILAHPSNVTIPLPNNTTPTRATASTTSARSSSHNSSTRASHTMSTTNSLFYLSDVALTLSLLVKNPTSSMGTYHYHQLNWLLLYHNITITKGSLQPFSKSPHDAHLPIYLHLKGAHIALPHIVASALQTNHGVLQLHASTTVYVQLLGKFIDFEFPVDCNLSFPHPRDGMAHIHFKTPCIVMTA